MGEMKSRNNIRDQRVGRETEWSEISLLSTDRESSDIVNENVKGRFLVSSIQSWLVPERVRSGVRYINRPNTV